MAPLCTILGSKNGNGPRPKVRSALTTPSPIVRHGGGGYCFERHQLFCLTDGRVVGVEQLAVGCGFTSKVGWWPRSPGRAAEDLEPLPPDKDETERGKRVVGTIKFTGTYP